MSDALLHNEMDVIRRDFIEAYAARWNCTFAYAEGLMLHVEITAISEEVEATRAIRNRAEGEGLFNRTYYEGFDDALERVLPS